MNIFTIKLSKTTTLIPSIYNWAGSRGSTVKIVLIDLLSQMHVLQYVSLKKPKNTRKKNRHAAQGNL